MKKKLLFPNVAREWNSLLNKFYKLQRRVSSETFHQYYSEQQQKRLVDKLKLLFKRLESLQHQVGIKIAATALAVMLTSAIASGQTNLWIQQDITVDSAFKSDETTWPIPGTDPAWKFGNMAFSDIDADGNQDCVVGYKDLAIKVWYADTDGKFLTNPVDLLADAAPILPDPDHHFITFADLDKDGDMDLFVGTSNGTVKEFTKAADKTFSFKGNISIDGYDALVQGHAYPAFADVDKDGNLDLFLTSYGTGGISRFMGKSDGTFTQIDDLSFDGGVTTKLVPFGWFQCTFADLDKDGDMDLYYWDQYGEWWECKNDGAGNFTKGGKGTGFYFSDTNGNPQRRLYHGYYPTISFVDMDKDGTVELYHMVWKGMTYKYLMYGATSGDMEAPTVPDGLAAADITSNSFILSWAASTDNIGVVEYEVFKDGTSLGIVETTQISVIGLSPVTQYQLTVKAKDAAGNISEASAPLAVTTISTGDMEAPAVPGGLAATDITSNSFILSWAASTDNIGVVGYEVFKDGTSLGNVETNQISVTGLSPVTQYQLTVKAKDAAGNISEASAPLAVITISTSVRNVADEQIILYPNPASDLLMIKGLKNAADIRIFNNLGALKAHYRNVSGNIDISSLSKGMYFITVNDGKINFTRKLIKN